MASVMKQMPENVRKMMDSGEVGPIGMREEGTAPDAAFIRLRYLQDLYRSMPQTVYPSMPHTLCDRTFQDDRIII